MKYNTLKLYSLENLTIATGIVDCTADGEMNGLLEADKGTRTDVRTTQRGLWRQMSQRRMMEERRTN